MGRITKSKDLVKSHSVELLSLGLFYLNFRDAIKEGDGPRVFTSWKYMLPIFIGTQRKNYAKEALPIMSIESIVRVSKVLGVLDPLLTTFDEEFNVPKPRGRHSIASQEQDRCTLIS